MIIREADLEKDALAIMDGAHDFINRIGFHSLFPENENEFISAIGYVMTLNNIEILLAEHNEKIVGGIGILYIPYIWNHSKTIGDELFFWTDKHAPFKTAVQLIDESINRIRKKNAIPIFRSLVSSPKGLKKLYHRLELTPVETSYIGL